MPTSLCPDLARQTAVFEEQARIAVGRDLPIVIGLLGQGSKKKLVFLGNLPGQWREKSRVPLLYRRFSAPCAVFLTRDIWCRFPGL